LIVVAIADLPTLSVRASARNLCVESRSACLAVNEMADRIQVGKNDERIVPLVFMESDVCCRNTIESPARNQARMQCR
jgi:hypothetical protein